MTQLKTYILNRFARTDKNYSSWMSDCPFQCEVVESFAPDWQVPADAGIVVTHLHYRWEEISALRRIYETTQVPILILADGVLEYRNTWENPAVADGSIFQPLIGHKLACLGNAQARTVESWGNFGQCEIVGLSRFDPVVASEYLPIRNEGPFRILIATANTPAFTQSQRDNVVDSLYLLRQRFDLNNTVNNRPVELTWRLTDGLGQEVGFPVEPDPMTKPMPLSDALELADAVITTPSTTYLESILKRRPTAILDFNNTPAYVPSAWTISAPAHLNQVLAELENPPEAKMLYQRSVLHDQLQVVAPARSRLYQLINSMVESGIQARQTGTSIRLPTKILTDPREDVVQIERDFDSISLYPNNPVFRMTETGRLQQELNQAIARLGQLPIELDQKDQDIIAKNSDIERKNAHIEQLVWELDELLAKKNEDIVKKNQHIDSLEELFKSANSRVQQLCQRYKEQAEMLLEMKTQLKQKPSMPIAETKTQRAA